jgi:hypothetical protein
MLFTRIRELRAWALNVGRRKVMLSQSMESLSLLSMVAVLAFCGWMNSQGWMNPEGLILYCSALFLCYKPVKECTRLAPQWRIAKSAYNLLVTLSLYPCRSNREYPAGSALALKKMSFGYGGAETPVFVYREEQWAPTPGKHLLFSVPMGWKIDLLRLIAHWKNLIRGNTLPESGWRGFFSGFAGNIFAPLDGYGGKLNGYGVIRWSECF